MTTAKKLEAAPVQLKTSTHAVAADTACADPFGTQVVKANIQQRDDEPYYLWLERVEKACAEHKVIPKARL